MGTKSVIIKNEMLEGHVRREESDERGLRIQTESVIVKVDGVQLWQSE